MYRFACCFALGVALWFDTAAAAQAADPPSPPGAAAAAAEPGTAAAPGFLADDGDGDGDGDGPAPVARAAVPAQAAQAEALKLVKEVFADEYAKRSADDRRALARRLVERAGEERTEATRYVMLREARDLAAGAGDVQAAVDAIDAMAQAFEVDALELKWDTLSAAARRPGDAGHAAATAVALLALVDEALAAAHVEHAGRIAAMSETAARRAKDPDLTARAGRRKREVQDLLGQYGPLKPLQDKLAKNPEDPAANLGMGKFLCFAVGDWDRGLLMLARGSDPALRTVAREDVAGGADAKARAALGDAWWDLAEQQRPAGAAARGRMRARAAHWYGQAVEELSGLEKTRVEKRMAAVQAGAEQDTAVAAGGAAAAGGAGAGVLEAMIRALPRERRPQPGQPWDSHRVGRWLHGQLFARPFDAELVVASATANVDYLSVSFEEVGPLERDGVKYGLDVYLSSRKDQPTELLSQLKTGVRVRVRAQVRNVSVNTRTGETPVDVERVNFVIGLGNPTFTLLSGKPPAAAAAGAGDADKAKVRP